MQKKNHLNQDKTKKQIQTFGVSGIGLLRELACSVDFFYLIVLYIRMRQKLQMIQTKKQIYF